MKSIKHLCSNGENIKNAFIKLGDMFVFLKAGKQNIDKKQITQAVKQNMPICVTDMAKNQDCIQLCPKNIFFPDLFLKKKDRVKKLCLELQNAY